PATELQLGDSAEGCIVGSGHGVSRRLGNELGDRGIPPPEVRGVADDAVFYAREAGDADSDSDDAVAGLELDLHAFEDRRRDVGDLDRSWRLQCREPDLADDFAPETDQAHGHGINLRVDGKSRE